MKSSDLQIITAGTEAARELLAREDKLERTYQTLSEESFMLFTRGLFIKAQDGKQRFEKVIKHFQKEFFVDLAPNVEALRDGRLPEKRRWWVERTKKASKDADLAVIIAWLVAYPTRPFYGQIGAADRTQAGIVRDRLDDLLYLNPWLNRYLELVGNEIRSKRLRPNGKPLAVIDIVSSDVSGSHGGTPDILIINELSHIKKFEFAETMMDNADGVAQGMAIIATNAGFKNTGPWEWRKNAISSKAWGVYVLAEPAPWHTTTTIQEAKIRNTPSRFRRLWKGMWSSGAGDAFDESAIEAIFCREYPSTFDPLPGWDYIGGLDLGVSKDHAGFVLVGVSTQLRKIRLAYMKRWDPKDNNGEVDLQDVQDTMVSVCKHYRAIALFYDPHQAVLMAQQARRQGVNVKQMTFSSSKNLTDMANSMKTCVENRVLELFDDQEGTLRKDFDKIRIMEKSYGYRIEACRDASGHADVGTALAIALPASIEMLEGSMFFNRDDEVAETDQKELTEEEIEALPDEFKELFDEDEDKSKTGELIDSGYFDDLT